MNCWIVINDEDTTIGKWIVWSHVMYCLRSTGLIGKAEPDSRRDAHRPRIHLTIKLHMLCQRGHATVTIDADQRNISCYSRVTIPDRSVRSEI